MPNFAKILSVSLALGGCAAKDAAAPSAQNQGKATSTAPAATPGGAPAAVPSPVAAPGSDDEAIVSAKPSANVSGAFLVALSCDVVNASDTAATQTTFGCSLKDEHGLNATGKVEPQSATVAAKGTSQTATAAVSQQPVGAGYQFALVAEGIKPGAAASVTFKVLYDGEPREFIYLVPASYLTKSTVDLDLYVDGAVGNDGGLCAAADPCKSISRAVSLVPDQIAHVVKIHVLPTALYEESIVIENRGIVGGRLDLIGEPGPNGERVKVSHPNGVFEFRNLRSAVGDVRLTGMDVEMSSAVGDFASQSFSSAILIDDSAVDLGDVGIKGSATIPSLLRTSGFSLGSPAGKEAIETVGYGLFVMSGGEVRLRRKVQVSQFATCLQVESGRLTIQADLELTECLKGLVASAGGQVRAAKAAAGDDQVGEPAAFGLKIERVAFGMILVGSASFTQHTLGLDSIQISQGDVAAVGTYGIYQTEASGFRFSSIEAVTVAIKDFEIGIAADSSSAFEVYTDSPQSVMTVTGCKRSCMLVKSSSVRATSGSIALAAAATSEGKVSELYDAATVEVTYQTSLTMTPSAPSSLVAAIFDRSLLAIYGANEGTVPFAPPAAKIYLTNASVLRAGHRSSSTLGAAASVGNVCELSSWNYANAPVVEGCVDID